MISRATEQRLVAGAAVLCALLFIGLPDIDLATSRLFFSDGQWSPWRDSLWVQALYLGVPPLGQGLLGLFALVFVLGFVPRLARLAHYRRHCAFWLVAALIGQGLIIDQGLKNQLGRARPSQIEAFGGERTFTPALVPSDQCARNCAFASGHVAAAAFLMGFGWLGTARQRRRWLAASLLAAGTMGLVRILQGGHFLSDAIFAWLFTYFSFWLTEVLFRWRGWLPPPTDPAHEKRPTTTVDR